MATPTHIQLIGNLLSVIFDSGNTTVAYPSNGSTWFLPNDPSNGTEFATYVIRELGNSLNIVCSDGSSAIAYPTNGDLWIVGAAGFTVGDGGGTPPVTTGWIWPLDKTKWVVTSEYGMRVNPVTGVYKLHEGIDISGSGVYGTPVQSPFDGTVVMAQVYSGFGQHVKVNHSDGSQTSFSHMVTGYVPVTVGQVITTGTVLGQVNNSGSSTGSHLHYETHNTPSETGINPRDFMTARGNTW